MEDRDSEWTEIELDTSLSFGTMRKVTAGLLEGVQQELEKLTATGESLKPLSRHNVALHLGFEPKQRV